MISLELINNIQKDDEDAIQDAFEQLSEELRGMRPDADFSDIGKRYDALNEIKESVIQKLEKISDDELEKMVAEDGTNMFFEQENFIKERHPVKETEEDAEAE